MKREKETNNGEVAFKIVHVRRGGSKLQGLKITSQETSYPKPIPLDRLSFLRGLILSGDLFLLGGIVLLGGSILSGDSILSGNSFLPGDLILLGTYFPELISLRVSPAQINHKHLTTLPIS